MIVTQICRCVISTALVACLATAAWADGTDDPAEARKMCEQRKEADTPEKLKQCCDDMIMADPPAKQAKLVAQCVQGGAKKSKGPAPRPK